MLKVEAQVLAVNDNGISVSPLLGDLKDKAFGLPFRESLEPGQFVNIVVHPSGQRAEWAPTG